MYTVHRPGAGVEQTRTRGRLPRDLIANFSLAHFFFFGIRAPFFLLWKKLCLHPRTLLQTGNSKKSS